MNLPSNGIHWYLGFPLMVFISIRGLYLYSKGKSTLDLYFGLVGVFFSLCFLSYGLPPLITDNSTVLTYSTILADTLQFVALFFVWLAAFRLVLPKNNSLGIIFIILDLLLITLGIYFSVTDNLSFPVTLTQTANSLPTINYQASIGYQLVTAIQYLGLILVSIAFFRRLPAIKSKGQKIRLASIAVVLLLIGCLYALQPLLSKPILGVSRASFIAPTLAIASLFIIFVPLAFGAKKEKITKK